MSIMGAGGLWGKEPVSPARVTLGTAPETAWAEARQTSNAEDCGPLI